MKRKRSGLAYYVDVLAITATIGVALGLSAPIVFPEEDPPCAKGFTCRDITLCNQGIAEVRRGGRPHICGWNRHVAKVCCPHRPNDDDEDPFFTALIGFQRNAQCGVLIVPQVNATAIANTTTKSFHVSTPLSPSSLTTLKPAIEGPVVGPTRGQQTQVSHPNKYNRPEGTTAQHRSTTIKQRWITRKPKPHHLPITAGTPSATASRSSANIPHNQVSSRRVQQAVPTTLPAQGRRLPQHNHQQGHRDYQYYQQQEQHYSVFSSQQAVNSAKHYSAAQVDNSGRVMDVYKDPGLWDPDFFSPGDHGASRVPGWFSPLRKRNADETTHLEGSGLSEQKQEDDSGSATDEPNLYDNADKAITEVEFVDPDVMGKSSRSRLEMEGSGPATEEASNVSGLGIEPIDSNQDDKSSEHGIEMELIQPKVEVKFKRLESHDALKKPNAESLKIARPLVVSEAYRRRIRVDGNDNNYQPERKAKKTGKVDARVPDPDILKAISPAVSFANGGVKADYNTWPWMASILRGSELKFLCGGFLINERYVLSAAHCFQDHRGTQTYGVRLGQIRFDEGPVYKVERFVIHEDYVRRQYYNDIALLRLAEPVPLALIRPVCLPSPVMARQSLVGREATVLGWGDTMFGGPRSDTLQEVNGLPIVDVRKCNESYSKLRGNPFSRGITREFICAGLMQGGKDACQGDSGGPLMLEYEGRWTAVGIVSFGYRCGEPGFPGVYTRISKHLRWIDNNIFMDSVGYNTIV